MSGAAEDSSRTWHGRSVPNPAAAAHLADAALAMQSYDFAAAADAVAKAYAEDPYDLEVNVQHLQLQPMRRYRWTGRTMEVDDEDAAKAEAAAFRDAMRAEYEARVISDPERADWHLLLARLAGKDADVAQRHLLDALAVDPTYAPAHTDLALICQKRGDNAGHLDHLRRAAELQFDDGSAWFSHAFACRGEARRAALLDFADRFPHHDRVAQALMEAAGETDEPHERVELLERAVASAGDGPMAAYPAMQLLAALAPVDPERAAAAADGRGPQFADTATLLRAIAVASRALEAGDAAAALAALAALDERPAQVMAGGDVARLLRIEALVGTGDVDTARAKLVERLTTTSTPELWAQAECIGDRAGIEADVWAARDAKATSALDFDVPTVDGGRVTLAGRRGRVTLLNFWYPGCGPCRNEFRYLAPVVERFEGRPFDVLAVNTVAEEDALVASFMHGNGYRFVAGLHDAAIVETYGIRATPANYLIDHEGRVQFQPGIHSRESALVLADLVDELVSRAEAATR